MHFDNFAENNKNSNIMKLKSLFSAAACALVATSAFAQPAQPKAPEYEFTVVKENPVTSIKNQYRSGT